ncbi:MAG: DJ-1/PfpI family protein [Nitriliruptorales bacterium]|nr:DJ-1/PfpI family protein [Nitriliruptorales bacterium]
MEDVTAAILLFERMTALDAIGPYEVLQRIPTITPVFVGLERGEVRTENGFLGLTVDAEPGDVPAPGVIVVPGGIGTRELARNERVLDWLQTAHERTRWTTSVCTGSLVLGAAGLLDGLTATTHWSVLHLLDKAGAQSSTQRVIEHPEQRIITAAGVSSGIDMALRLVELLVDETAARAAQLMIEYDPQPRFDAGAVSRASEDVLARVVEYAAQRD